MAETASWGDAPGTWPLGQDDVHVWLAAPDELASYADRLAAVLSPDERERAARYRLSPGRLRYILVRGTLRLLLGSYSGTAPGAIGLRYGPHGKPGLAPGISDGTLRFNLSHSHDRALFAFVRHREIGVDLEHVHALPNADRIAARYFSWAEQAALSMLPEVARKDAFFRCWTRKEAYVKAVGGGISMTLSSFDVALAPGEPPRLLAVAGQADAATRWSLHELPPLAGYASALAVEGHDLALRCWRWTAGTVERTLAAQPWL